MREATICVAIPEAGRGGEEARGWRTREPAPTSCAKWLLRLASIGVLVAVTVVAEVGDFRRFTDARQLMASLGLVPSGRSSGSTVRRTGITRPAIACASRTDRGRLDLSHVGPRK